MTDTAIRTRQGVLFAIAAYTIWGVAPIYFKLLAAVPAAEILSHRIIWSFILVFGLILLTSRLERLKPILRHRPTMLKLALATVLLGGNWFLFIWAVNADRILDASLGYYINPLLNVAIGMAFFGERMRRMQWVAIAMAVTGVMVQIVSFGEVPWIALVLATSFSVYGGIRKRLPVDSITGLWLETLILLPIVLIYMLFFANSMAADMSQNSWSLNLLLIAAGIVTTVPLLCFTAAAQRIRYSTLGFFQYIGPSLMFVVAVWLYNEPLAMDKLVTFGIIWAALALYSIDTIIFQSRSKRA
ncbi:EamA family transporter RarD [Pseudidiomarina mangrovi]|uniref:EamA family transporter RarD n=1 Tax=Pseudidiomarina mangrovi TaxID=2487133 RepID=UPI000FC9DC33|nr:EamA family transporter RarD [Pseudidiomarina mangrovi]